MNVFESNFRQYVKSPAGYMQVSCLQFSAGLEVLWAGDHLALFIVSLTWYPVSINLCAPQGLRAGGCMPCNVRQACRDTAVCEVMTAGSMTCKQLGTELFLYQVVPSGVIA